MTERQNIDNGNDNGERLLSRAGENDSQRPLGKPTFDLSADDFLEPMTDPASKAAEPAAEPAAEAPAEPDEPDVPNAKPAASTSENLYVSPYEALDARREGEKAPKPLVRPAVEPRYDAPYDLHPPVTGPEEPTATPDAAGNVPDESDASGEPDEPNEPNGLGESKVKVAPAASYAGEPTGLSDAEREELALAAEKLRAAQKARNEAIRAQNAAREAERSGKSAPVEANRPSGWAAVTDSLSEEEPVPGETGEAGKTAARPAGPADASTGQAAPSAGSAHTASERPAPCEKSSGSPEDGPDESVREPSAIPPVEALLALEDEHPEDAPVARWRAKLGAHADGVKPEDTRTSHLKITVFAGAMLLAFLIGLLIPLRPTFSEGEKRELARFPAFRVGDFLSGDFFAGVETWYADSFPGRDALLSANSALRSLYGFRGEQITHGGSSETVDTRLPEDLESYLESLERAKKGDSDSETDDTGSEPIIDPITGEKINGLYVAGDTAYELSYYNETAAMTYAALISRASSLLGDGVRVYDLVVPLSYSIYLSDAQQKALGVANAPEAIDHIYAAIGNNSSVRTVEITPALLAHRDEYLYFRTDHHWTARGAYYAYAAFCGTAGLTPFALSDWDAYSFDGFLGTLFSEANTPAAMRNRPDTVEAWVPNGTNTIYITDKTGERLKYTGGLVRKDTDSFYQSAASKYNCFLMGDSPLCEIRNPNITDGSSIAVVKESFGNALVPFLVDHYETVWVLDYRYFGGTLPEFVASHGIGNVLFINNAVAVWSKNSPRLDELWDFIGN